MANRTTYDPNGSLDEIVTDGGAHLENLGGDQWFLSCKRQDGSEVVAWITGRVDGIEERDPVKCAACGHPFGAHPNTTPRGHLLCRECGHSPDPSN